MATYMVLVFHIQERRTQRVRIQKFACVEKKNQKMYYSMNKWSTETLPEILLENKQDWEQVPPKSVRRHE